MVTALFSHMQGGGTRGSPASNLGAPPSLGSGGPPGGVHNMPHSGGPPGGPQGGPQGPSGSMGPPYPYMQQHAMGMRPRGPLPPQSALAAQALGGGASQGSEGPWGPREPGGLMPPVGGPGRHPQGGNFGVWGLVLGISGNYHFAAPA